MDPMDGPVTRDDDPTPSTRSRESELDRAIEAQLLDLLKQRGPDKTICPSEVARAVFERSRPADGRDTGDGWRALMDPVRRVADRLVAAGDVVVTQRGRVVDATTAEGPIRLGRGTSPGPRSAAE